MPTWNAEGHADKVDESLKHACKLWISHVLQSNEWFVDAYFLPVCAAVFLSLHSLLKRILCRLAATPFSLIMSHFFAFPDKSRKFPKPRSIASYKTFIQAIKYTITQCMTIAFWWNFVDFFHTYVFCAVHRIGNAIYSCRPEGVLPIFRLPASLNRQT